MQVVDNKALQFVTRKFEQIAALIPKSKILERNGPMARMLVYWGHEEWQLLRNLGLKNPPHPITGRYKWPGIYKPFKHQLTTAEFLVSNPRCYCFNEQGTGKTNAAAWAADYLLTKGLVKRVLVVCPVSIMDTAWRADLFRTLMHRSVGIATGTRSQREAVIKGNYEFVIINFDGVKVVQEALLDGGFDLVIADECFVAGTPVATPSGSRAIETIKPGDIVLTSAGPQRIKTTSQRESTNLVTVRLSDGHQIICTRDHPFFTDLGWVTAENLSGRRLVLSHELRDVRARVPHANSAVAVAPQQGDGNWPMLLSILRSEEIPPAESGGELFSPHETGGEGLVKGRSALCGVPGKNIGDPQEEWVQTKSSWGQRDRPNCDGSVDPSRAAAALGLELPRSVGREAARLSYELQTGLWQPGEEGGARGRWQQPQYGESQDTGREKSGKTCGTWVDSVSYNESGSGQIVYNLEVEGAPNYFVGPGVLVHNCTAVKNVQTERWKALNAICKPGVRVWAMTGTPAAQSPLDAYGLAKLVRPESVPRSFTHWRDMVMVKITQFKWVAKATAKDIVRETLQPAIRFTKEECLDLPDMLYATREVQMTPQQHKFYEQVKTHMVALAAGEEITAANAATLLNKLTQISLGAVYADTGEVIQFDIKNRLAELMEIVNGTEHKVLVFVPFRHVLDMLHDALVQELGDPNAVEFIHGGVPAGQRAEVIKRFQTEDTTKVLLLVPQATAHGITLTRADNIVWWGPITSTEVYLQANARAHRAGQTNKVTVTHLQGSPVERRMYTALQGKVNDHMDLVELYKQEIDSV